MSGDRHVGVTQHRMSHCQRIDGIGLATGARRSAGLRHQLRCHAHHRLAGAEQITLQTR